MVLVCRGLILNDPREDEFVSKLLEEALTYGQYLTDVYETFGNLWNKRGVNHARSDH